MRVRRVVSVAMAMAALVSVGCTTARGSRKSDASSSGADGTASADGTDGTASADGTVSADGTDGTASADGTDGTASADGTDGTASADGTVSTDGTDGTDGTVSADGTDGTDGTASTDGTVSTDGTDGTVSTDGTDGTSSADGTDGTTGGGCDVPAAVAAVITSSCSPCHTNGGSNGGLALDPAKLIANTVNKKAQSSQSSLVVPGDAASSYLILKVKGLGAGPVMPPGGSLSAQQIDTLESWVNGLDCGSTDGTDGTDATDGTDGGPGNFGLPAGCVLGTVGCNPLTNEGCSVAGEACDLTGDGQAFCFPAPNDVPLGGSCDNSNGPFCVATNHCNGGLGVCERFCCSEQDCKAGETCLVIDPSAGTAGSCTPL